jgi:hypothetical protein
VALIGASAVKLAYWESRNPQIAHDGDWEDALDHSMSADSKRPHPAVG